MAKKKKKKTHKVTCSKCGSSWDHEGDDLEVDCPLCAEPTINDGMVTVIRNESEEDDKVVERGDDFEKPEAVVISPSSMRTQTCSLDELITTMRDVRSGKEDVRVFELGKEINVVLR